ncbi:hypothetical protein CEXT_484011 [Caerostris extrusa]|uniref:Uncharacterized protein n=1 Tax=Caerostris extrusa TaxID=172846 RepID=A0AAV4PL84_CAEEX|nr:hypothetical protein CEXT_484011 [Caerostris extrusa]
MFKFCWIGSDSKHMSSAHTQVSLCTLETNALDEIYIKSTLDKKQLAIATRSDVPNASREDYRSDLNHNGMETQFYRDCGRELDEQRKTPCLLLSCFFF